MKREAAWNRVQCALDERRDPLDDELLQEAFAEHPSLLEDYARLEQCLAALGSSAGCQPSRVEQAPAVRRRIGALLATLAASTVLLITAQLTRDPRDAMPGAHALANSRLVDYELSVSRSTPVGEKRSSRRMNGTLHRTNTIIGLPIPAAGARVYSMQFTTQEETRTR